MVGSERRPLCRQVVGFSVNCRAVDRDVDRPDVGTDAPEHVRDDRFNGEWISAVSSRSVDPHAHDHVPEVIRAGDRRRDEHHAQRRALVGAGEGCPCRRFSTRESRTRPRHVRCRRGCCSGQLQFAELGLPATRLGGVDPRLRAVFDALEVGDHTLGRFTSIRLTVSFSVARKRSRWNGVYQPAVKPYQRGGEERRERPLRERSQDTARRRRFRQA